MSMLESSVFKNLTQRTSQCVELTSGARDLINSSNWFNSHFDRSIARSLERLLDGSIARSLARSITRSIARSLFDRPLDRSIARSIAREVVRKRHELFRGYELELRSNCLLVLGSRLAMCLQGIDEGVPWRSRQLEHLQLSRIYMKEVQTWGDPQRKLTLQWPK